MPPPPGAVDPIDLRLAYVPEAYAAAALLMVVVLALAALPPIARALRLLDRRGARPCLRRRPAPPSSSRSPWAGARSRPSRPRRLLAASDLFARAPAELRLELEVGAEGAPERVPLEIWRSGPERALVRFLDPRERGKFVLRLGAETYFLAPGASRPVKLGAAFRLQGGAALDELLGLALARDYRIAAVESAGGVTTFDLEAKSPTAAYPKVRWAVDAARRRPLRAELRTSAGKALRVIEFRSWLDEKKLVPAKWRSPTSCAAASWSRPSAPTTPAPSPQPSSRSTTARPAPRCRAPLGRALLQLDHRLRDRLADSLGEPGDVLEDEVDGQVVAARHARPVDAHRGRDLAAGRAPGGAAASAPAR